MPAQDFKKPSNNFKPRIDLKKEEKKNKQIFVKI